MIISGYEAATIHALVRCLGRGKAYFHIWYLYVQSGLQLLQVINLIRVMLLTLVHLSGDELFTKLSHLLDRGLGIQDNFNHPLQTLLSLGQATK